MSALEQKLLFCFPKKNQMCKQRSNYYHYYCLICSMWRGIKRWNVQKTYKQLFLSVLCQVKDKKRGKQWFSRGTAKCVSTFPSSLRVTSAAPQTAGRRSRLQQPYSSATPLKSGPPETGKKKQEADATCNDKNDKSEMANLSLTEAMTFKRAGVKMVFFKVLSKLFISRHWSVEAPGQKKTFTPEASAVTTGIQAFFPLCN